MILAGYNIFEMKKVFSEDKLNVFYKLFVEYIQKNEPEEELNSLLELRKGLSKKEILELKNYLSDSTKGPSLGKSFMNPDSELLDFLKK